MSCNTSLGLLDGEKKSDSILSYICFLILGLLKSSVSEISVEGFFSTKYVPKSKFVSDWKICLKIWEWKHMTNHATKRWKPPKFHTKKGKHLILGAFHFFCHMIGHMIIVSKNYISKWSTLHVREQNLKSSRLDNHQLLWISSLCTFWGHIL